ncbi:hypothetical protein C0993_007322, partial [Termitomyces sp. T159_Od127]
PHPQTQLNAIDMQETLNLNQADNDLSQDPHNTLDYADNEVALCTSRFRNWPWIDVLEKTQEQQRCEEACILCSEQGHFINECPKCQVVRQAMWTIDGKDYLKDALNCRLDPDVFSTLATHLHATALSLDTLLAHLPSQSSQTLLLHTTLLTSALINTLVNSGATDNFIDESLMMLIATSQ